MKYSLRFLLILTLLIALLTGWIVDHRGQTSVIEDLRDERVMLLREIDFLEEERDKEGEKSNGSGLLDE